MQSDILQLEREALSTGNYHPLVRAATLMRLNDQDPTSHLDRVLQMSEGKMFIQVRDEFPEYIDGIATRLVEDAREFADTFTDQDMRDRIYGTIVGPLAHHNYKLAKELAATITDQGKLEWAYVGMTDGLTLNNSSKAMELANKIEFPLYRECAYFGIAVQLALPNLTLALEVADKISNPYAKADTYCAIALEFIPDNYDLAMQIANKIHRTKCREKTYREIEKKLNPPHANEQDRQITEEMKRHKILVALTRSAKFEDFKSHLRRTISHERADDYCTAIKGLTKDGI